MPTFSPYASTGSPATLEDRRRSPRKAHVMEAFLTPAQAPAGTDPFEVLSVNLSAHGVGMDIPRAVQVGEEYVVEIGYGQQRLISRIRVANCQRTEHGTYRVGAEFC